MFYFARDPPKQRYDIFILEDFWTVSGSPNEIYDEMKAFVLEHCPAPVTLADAVWLEDPFLLREEMAATANRNCLCGQANIQKVGLEDWTQLLSKEESDNYSVYLKKLGMLEVPAAERELKAVAVTQDPEEFPFMSKDDGTCCAFTTSSTKRIMLTSKNRWLSAVEKLAMAGLPVSQDRRVCKICKGANKV